MRWLLFISFLLFILGCGPSPEYQEEKEIDPTGWSTDEVLDFKTSITDTSSVYELQLIIEHTPEYRYQNIYLQIETLFPSQDPKSEQLTIDLATKSGEWVGNCSGKSCKCKVFLLDKFKFPTSGDYGFNVRQFTRDASLSGIKGMQMALYRKEMEKG